MLLPELEARKGGGFPGVTQYLLDISLLALIEFVAPECVWGVGISPRQWGTRAARAPGVR